MAPPSGTSASSGDALGVGAAAAAAAAYSPGAKEAVSEHPDQNYFSTQKPTELKNQTSPPKMQHQQNKPTSASCLGLSQQSSSQCSSSFSQDSVVSMPASVSSPPMSPSGKSHRGNLTADQVHRMEENRRRALERKRQKQMQMQRAEENRQKALATKEERRRKRMAARGDNNNAGAEDSKKPRAAAQRVGSSINDAPDLKLPPIQRTVDGVTLSEEQYQIVAMARPPSKHAESKKPRHLVRITAAAGTGKTTTLIRLALRCIELGHDHLTYVTFSKASADDAKRRIEAALASSSRAGQHQNRFPIIHASTLHSCAQQLNNEARAEQADAVTAPGKLLDEEDFKQLILTVCGEEIERYLGPAYRNIENGGGGGAVGDDGRPIKPSAETIASRKRRALQQVVYFIWKTFMNCFAYKKTSVEDFNNKSNDWRHFYTVKCGWHSAGEKGEKEFGFPSQEYGDKAVFSFYADMACKIWSFAESQDLRSHDIEMKRAQLNKRRIRGSILLVDESQDLDGAQIDWVKSQAEKYGTHVFFVGDAAQTIYSFRGAKSRHLMSLKATDLSLTTSFRFGKNIARVANTILFAKEHSSDTPAPASNKGKTWNPYRLKGLANMDCIVTDEPILPLWTEKQITLIGYSNGGLMIAAMAAMGMGSLLGGGDTDEDEDDETSEKNYVKKEKMECSAIADILPKICINGKGEGSGIKKWRQTIKQIETLHQLYSTGAEGMQLPSTFPEFANQRITWDTFKKDVEAREMTKYASSVQVIEAYGERTGEAISFFEEEVITKRFNEDEADIILTTCHSAKGMEWDNCQLLDDFVGLYSFTDRDRDKKEVDHSTFDSPLSPMSQDFTPDAKRKGKTRNRWQFDVPPYGDSVNLLYVACTRAKKTLSIPPKLRKLYAELDALTSIVNLWQAKFIDEGEDLSLSVGDEDTQYVDVKKDSRNLNKKEICQLYSDICVPLRDEAGLTDGEEFIGNICMGLGHEGEGNN